MSGSALVFNDVHITVAEYRCPCCKRLPPHIYENPYYHLLFTIWEYGRNEWGRPVPISKDGGGWRCPYFIYLDIINGLAKTAVSPHGFFALDSDLDSEKEVKEFANIFEHKFPEVRLGYLKYLEMKPQKTLVHLDIAYLVEPRPSETWVEGYRW